jgi:hypothetical protein
MVQGQVDEGLLGCLEVGWYKAGHGVPPDHATDFVGQDYEQHALSASLYAFPAHLHAMLLLFSLSVDMYSGYYGFGSPGISTICGGESVRRVAAIVTPRRAKIYQCCLHHIVFGRSGKFIPKWRGLGRPEAVWLMRLVQESMPKMAGDKM